LPAASAGIQYVSPVEEFPEDKWDDIIAVCLNSAFHTTKAALPYMLQQGWGRIVNTGSMHALVASPYKSAYNAAKHGIAGFTKTVALELAQKNITCNAICPGYVLTGMVLLCSPAVLPRVGCRRLLVQGNGQQLQLHSRQLLALAHASRLESCCLRPPSYVITYRVVWRSAWALAQAARHSLTLPLLPLLLQIS
jgi:NAD(P)-dependent dehydrogenase (short-subunit alcohol dehydrogenase family)